MQQSEDQTRARTWQNRHVQATDLHILVFLGNFGLYETQFRQRTVFCVSTGDQLGAKTIENVPLFSHKVILTSQVCQNWSHHRKSRKVKTVAEQLSSWADVLFCNEPKTCFALAHLWEWVWHFKRRGLEATPGKYEKKVDSRTKGKERLNCMMH